MIKNIQILFRSEAVSDEMTNYDAHIKQNDILKKILNKIISNKMNQSEVFIFFLTQLK